MRKLVLPSIALLALNAGGSALAADMPVRPAPPLLPVFYVFSWTGFYAGGELGAKWMQSEWTTTSLLNSGAGLPITTIDTSSPRHFHPSGVRVGGYVGYNWQFAREWIGGVELDIAYADKTTTTAGVPGCTILCTEPFTPELGPDQSSVRMRWDASARARLGFLVAPDVLVYGTAGIAWQNIQTSATCQHSGPDPLCGSVDGRPIVTATDTFTQVGWTAGGGLDWRVYGNWIARAEYRYSQFGTRNGLLDLSVPDNTTTVGYQLRASTQIATLGLAYKFGGPDVARY